MIVGLPATGKLATTFDPSQYWGNLSPQISIDSAVYGLPGATLNIPDQCEVTHAHYYYRHGARYPTTGNGLAVLAQKLHNVSVSTGFNNALGPLSFLNTWTYKLGAEILTPFDRQQNFMLGVSARLAYGSLLKNQTATGKLPVFRTESQD